MQFDWNSGGNRRINIIINPLVTGLRQGFKEFKNISLHSRLEIYE